MCAGRKDGGPRGGTCLPAAVGKAPAHPSPHPCSRNGGASQLCSSVVEPQRVGADTAAALGCGPVGAASKVCTAGPSLGEGFELGTPFLLLHPQISMSVHSGGRRGREEWASASERLKIWLPVLVSRHPLARLPLTLRTSPESLTNKLCFPSDKSNRNNPKHLAL